jgi:hypothetical protein
MVNEQVTGRYGRSDVFAAEIPVCGEQFHCLDSPSLPSAGAWLDVGGSISASARDQLDSLTIFGKLRQSEVVGPDVHANGIGSGFRESKHTNSPSKAYQTLLLCRHAGRNPSAWLQNSTLPPFGYIGIPGRPLY